MITRSIVTALSLVGAFLSTSCHTVAVREVTLVTRGMMFALPERPEASNPRLTFRPGERVRLHLA